MPAVQDYADVQVVFAALRDASENKHLPAFERCGGGQGQGMGQGKGMGMGHGRNAAQP
jgi:transketolase N-terminal domain/subunit